MNQKDRVITLVIKLTQDEFPQWISDIHLGKDSHNLGISINTMANGDYFKKYFSIKKTLNEVYETLGEIYD